MTTATPAAVSSERVRARARASDRNLSACGGICAASVRNEKPFKTKPIVPSLPNGAARCAFERSGAQRARDQKSAECRIFSRGFPRKMPGPWRREIEQRVSLT